MSEVQNPQQYLQELLTLDPDKVCEADRPLYDRLVALDGELKQLGENSKALQDQVRKTTLQMQAKQAQGMLLAELLFEAASDRGDIQIPSVTDLIPGAEVVGLAKKATG